MSPREGRRRPTGRQAYRGVKSQLMSLWFLTWCCPPYPGKSPQTVLFVYVSSQLQSQKIFSGIIVVSRKSGFLSEIFRLSGHMAVAPYDIFPPYIPVGTAYFMPPAFFEFSQTIVELKPPFRCDPHLTVHKVNRSVRMANRRVLGVAMLVPVDTVGAPLPAPIGTFGPGPTPEEHNSMLIP